MGWLYRSPYLGAVGIVLAATVGAVADDWGAWWIFAVSAGQVMFSLFLQNWHLQDTAKPKLAFRFDPDHAPYVREKVLSDPVTKMPNGILRIFSVGVTNSGESAEGVSVKVMKIEPPELEQYWAAKLHVMNARKRSAATRTVHRSPDQPLIYFEVVSEAYMTAATRPALMMRFAGKQLWHRALPYRDKYYITLAIDGPGAGRRVRYAVCRDPNGRYFMNVAIGQPD